MAKKREEGSSGLCVWPVWLGYGAEQARYEVGVCFQVLIMFFFSFLNIFLIFINISYFNFNFSKKNFDF